MVFAEKKCITQCFGGVADFNRIVSCNFYLPNIDDSTIIKACYLDIVIQDPDNRMVLEEVGHIIKSIRWELGGEIMRLWIDLEHLKKTTHLSWFITDKGKKKVRIMIPWVTTDRHFPTTYLARTHELRILVDFTLSKVNMSLPTEDTYIENAFISLDIS